MIRVVNKHIHEPTTNDVYIGRGSVLGNPFTGSKKLSDTTAEFQSDSREDAINSYETYLLAKIKTKDELVCNELNRIFKLSKVNDVNLVCYCYPKSCHGDIIKKILDSQLSKGSFKEIEGDLIKLAKTGVFNVITHSCNCFCKQGKGIALTMKQKFHSQDTAIFTMEKPEYAGDVNKLGQIQVGYYNLEDDSISTAVLPFEDESKFVAVVNSYTQYFYGLKNGPPVDYDAITLCLRKINMIFKGKKIGLPRISCNLAGGDWNIIKPIIQKELKDMYVTIVNKI